MASLQSANAHYRTQRELARKALAAARAGRNGSLDRLVAVMVAYQVAVATDAATAVPLMLAEQGIDTTSDAQPQPRALAATASDGRDLGGLMEYAQSTEVTSAMFDMIVLTQLSDAARGSSIVAQAVRPASTGYVRMLEGGSCSRCVVLAGKFYRTNQGFQRHPKCDCRHIPSSEDVADDLRTDPRAYFRSLTESEQDKAFTKAGAAVIREGADISKVVNARRGMSTAQTATGRRRLVRTDVYGRPLYTTTAGARRGAVRLMPESIVELAGGDRIELLRLLKSHGYLKK